MFKARDLFRQAEPERRFQEWMINEMMGKIEEAGLDAKNGVPVRQSLNTELRGHLQTKFSEGIGRTQPNLDKLQEVIQQILRAFEMYHPGQVPSNLSRNSGPTKRNTKS